ncbi:Tubby- protein 2 [Coemansia aciculifera]|nr:Tubby- protein 2 [Coemansia aciculifera]
MSSSSLSVDPLLQQLRLLCTSVPLAACTHCRLVRSPERGANATLDLYEELSATPTVAPAGDDNLGNHVLHVAKRKGSVPWRGSYDMYLSPSLAGSPSVLVGRVVPTTAGGVYTILQRSSDYVQTLLTDESQIQWQEVCAVQYDSHVLGSTGPREMTVVVHAVDDSGLPPLATETKSLIDRYRSGADTDPGIIPLINKPPIFISETASYALDFGPRITTRSVKNFQLIHPHDKDYIIMQFGKSGLDSFALDIRFPMSPIMALGVAITSLDRKVIYNLALPFFSSDH